MDGSLRVHGSPYRHLNFETPARLRGVAEAEAAGLARVAVMHAVEARFELRAADAQEKVALGREPELARPRGDFDDFPRHVEDDGDAIARLERDHDGMPGGHLSAAEVGRAQHDGTRRARCATRK